MALSKRNLDKLKSFTVKDTSEMNNTPNKDSTNKKNHLTETDSLNSNNPYNIFYEIIDNSENIEDTNIINQKFKQIEENTIKSTHNSSFSSIHKNNLLSEEDLLYDEFNYLLED